MIDCPEKDSPMTSRRQFLASAAAASALTAVKARAAKTSPTGFPHTEFEARIARRDFRDMTKDVLPTPCRWSPLY
jgi:hypothetical protein